jgi:hypothetical protein
MRHLTLALLTLACGAPAALAQCGWETLPSPSGTGAVNRFLDIHATTMDQAWGVAFLTGQGPQIAEFDGQSWSFNSGPDVSSLPGPFSPSGPNLQLTGVATLPNGEVWAAGWGATPSPSLQIGWPIVARWDGSSWHDIEQIDLGLTAFAAYDRGGVIEGMTASPDGDIWAYGIANASKDSPGTDSLLTIRYHNGQWTPITMPLGLNRFNILSEVLAFSQDNALLIGYGRSVGSAFFSTIGRWDGNAWSDEPTPITNESQTFAACATATGPDDIWVAGETLSGALFMHFDGTNWTVFPSPVTTPTRISHIAARTSNDVWAWSALTRQAFHFDGKSWSLADSWALPGTTVHGINHMTKVDSADAVWSVGTYADAASVTHTLAQRFTCANTCPADLAPPIGTLNFFDVSAFLGAYNTQAPEADFAAPLGTFNFFDVAAFLAAYNAGCP